MLHLRGFGDFKKRVLFVKVKGEEGAGDPLVEVFGDLQGRFRDAGNFILLFLFVRFLCFNDFWL